MLFSFFFASPSCNRWQLSRSAVSLTWWPLSAYSHSRSGLPLFFNTAFSSSPDHLRRSGICRVCRSPDWCAMNWAGCSPILGHRITAASKQTQDHRCVNARRFLLPVRLVPVRSLRPSAIFSWNQCVDMIETVAGRRPNRRHYMTFCR